jgi:hypothetical protein
MRTKTPNTPGTIRATSLSMDGSSDINSEHLAEAIQYRSLDNIVYLFFGFPGN